MERSLPAQNELNVMAPDWKNANEDLVRAAVTDGEAKLDAQLRIATSADQRASVLAGIYIAAATGIIGAVVTRTGQSGLPLSTGAAASALAFMGGALCCIMTMLPTAFWTAGNEPNQWYKDINNNVPIKEALGEQAENLTERLQANTVIIEKNATRFRCGALLGAFAPAIGLAVAAIISLFWK